MALPEQIHFELVSPEEKLVSEPAYMVIAPGDEGDFAAMPGSASLLSSLRAGVVTIHWHKDGEGHSDQSPLRVFITGGFADVTGTQCTILAEDASDVSEFNQAEIEQTIRNLQEDHGMAQSDKKRQAILENLNIAKSKLEAMTGKAIVSL